MPRVSAAGFTEEEWVHVADNIEELRLALIAFKHRYNTEWLVQKHGHLSPAQARVNLTQTAATAA